jgi:tetratricopeptide (TPR) repeat protein
MTTRSTLVTVTLCSALALAAGAASAQPSTSPHEATATAAYEAGDLETALREFEAAYVDTKRPDLLYVIARLHTERKDCTRGIEYFQRYLATNPGQTQTEAARNEITKCLNVLDAQKPPPAHDPVVEEPELTPPPSSAGTDTTSPATTTVVASTRDGSGSIMSDKLGVGLFIGGLVAEGAAVVLYVQARNAQCGDPVCTELTYDEYLDAEDKAKKLQLTSIVVAGAGAVLLGGAIYRFSTRDQRRAPALSLVPTHDGAAVTFSGRF